MSEIQFGALAPKLTEQLQGLPEIFDRYADAVTILSVKRIISSQEAQKARKRIVRMIEKRAQGID